MISGATVLTPRIASDCLIKLRPPICNLSIISAASPCHSARRESPTNATASSLVTYVLRTSVISALLSLTLAEVVSIRSANALSAVATTLRISVRLACTSLS